MVVVLHAVQVTGPGDWMSMRMGGGLHGGAQLAEVEHLHGDGSGAISEAGFARTGR